MKHSGEEHVPPAPASPAQFETLRTPREHRRTVASNLCNAFKKALRVYALTLTRLIGLELMKTVELGQLGHHRLQ